MGELKVRELNPALGAEIEGFDPRAEHDDAGWAALSEVFDDRGLLVFRDVELDAVEQHRLVEALFAGGRSVAIDPDEETKTSWVSNRVTGAAVPYGRLLFHSDGFWSSAIPAHNISLYGIEVEQPSVPTVYASTKYAWRTLPADLRTRVEGRQARHENGRQGRGDTDYEETLLWPKWNEPVDTIDPIERIHPRTGASMLGVTEQQTREIIGLPKDESDALLDALLAHLYRREYLLTHQWRAGDLVVWDNLTVQHGRPDVVASGPTRTLRKVIGPWNVYGSIGTLTYDRAS